MYNLSYIIIFHVVESNKKEGLALGTRPSLRLQFYPFSLYFTTKSSLLFLDQQDSVFSVQMGFSSP